MSRLTSMRHLLRKSAPNGQFANKRQHIRYSSGISSRTSSIPLQPLTLASNQLIYSDNVRNISSSSSSLTASPAAAASSSSPPLDAALSFQPGQQLHGYTVDRVESVPELAVVAVLLRHDVTGAQFLHLAREDADNTFAVAFRTTPMDSTGVPHILEHTVLCGSRKYPVRDPFFKMLNRSMATFMNAMTASDWTMYPFSTQNTKDFDNLLDVYLDACFFPNLRQQDFNQEGWRLEHTDLEDPSSPIIIKGVVFNEMKGVFSDSKRLYAESAQNMLLPSHTYGVCSGGDPVHIPKLGWNQLRDFHASHYHPTNSLFITYGDLPLESHLSKVSSRVLAHFDPNHAAADEDAASDAVQRLVAAASTEVPSEPRWTTPRSSSIVCAPDPMAPVAGKETSVSKSYLLSSVLDDFEVFLLSFVSKLLVETETSPFYQSLLCSNLGADFSPNTGFDNNCKDTSFAVGLQGVAASDAEEVLSIIDRTWEQIVENGFDDKDVDAILHKVELQLKHQSTNFGLRLIFGLIPSLNHGGDPLKALRLDEKVSQFKSLRQSNPRFLQDLVAKHFVGNPHCLTLTMSPSTSYSDELAAKEAAVLAGKLQNLNEADKETILSGGRQLAAEQNAEEDLTRLPTLTLADVDRTIIRDVVETTPLMLDSTLSSSSSSYSSSHRLLYLSPQPTNGVTYFRLMFSLADLSPHLLPLLPFFAEVLTKIGAEDLDYMKLSQEIDLCSGGLNVSPMVSAGYADLQHCESSLLLSSHCLDRNLDRMLSLWSSVLDSPRWEDEDRLSTLVRISASDAASSVLSSGHAYAMKHASSAFSPAGRMNEKLFGITQVAKLKDIAARVEAEGASFLVSDLRQIASQVLRRDSVLRVALNSSPETASSAADAVADFVGTKVPAMSFHSEEANMEEASGVNDMKTQFELPFLVNFASKSFPTVPYTHPDSAPLRVLAKLLSSKYCHREIREKGGAYGGGATGSTEGHFAFYSYRDPRSLETLEVYDKAVRWAADGQFTDTDVDEAKMGLFQQLDKPVAPGNRGTQLSLNLLGDEDRQTHRDRIFGTSRQDLRRVAEDYLMSSSSPGVTLLGPKNEKIDETWNVIQFS